PPTLAPRPAQPRPGPVNEGEGGAARAAVPAIAAARRLGGHVSAEDLLEEACDGVPVEHQGPIDLARLVHAHLLQLPVGPKRSVLMRSGATPLATSASATDSTSSVGPHTKMRPSPPRGPRTSRSISPSIRRV